MNFFFFALISSLFLFASGQFNPLLIWKIDNPTTTYTPESNKFSLVYDVHTEMSDRNIKAKVFTSTCQNPDDGSKGIEVSGGITVEKMGASDGKGSFEFVLDVRTLTENKDIFDTTNPNKPMIKLCARYMLWTPDREVNFIESLLNVQFDLTGSEITYSGFVSKAFDSSGNVVS